MALIRKLFWFAVFVASTFFFVVLFDYGTTNFSKNAKTEFEEFKKFIKEDIVPPSKKKTDDEKAKESRKP